MNEAEFLQDLAARFRKQAHKDNIELPTEEVKNLLDLGRKYFTLYEVGKLISSEMDFGSLMRIAMDKVLEVSKAQRGFIALLDDHGELEFKVARNIEKGDVAKPQFQISRTIIDKVLATGEAICLPDAIEDNTFGATESVTRLQLLSVLCAPIKQEDQLIGLIYVDNSDIKNLFDASIGELISAFSEQVAIALANAFAFTDLKESHSQLANELREQYQFSGIVGSGKGMTEILNLVGDVADTDATVLIQGENGTGKGMIARALHFNSRRAEESFIKVNCGAIPSELIESELFGHVKGSFTGAIKNKRGKFELAHQGTIFLDEIGEMSPALQVRLLNVLENGTYVPVGGEEEKQCDVRVIAATNRDIKGMIQENAFREDLYYRLNVISLTMPPLRERKEDILLLLQHFIIQHNTYPKPPKVSKIVENMLLNFNYPGNVRQLENIVQRAIILCKGKTIEQRHLPEEVLLNYSTDRSRNVNATTFTQRKQMAVESFERDELIRLLTSTGGKLRESARIAGMDVKNFSEKLKRYGIDASEYKV